MRAAIAGTVTRLLTSPRLREAKRSMRAAARRVRGRPATVHFFHQPDDPHSHLLLQALPEFASRYAVELCLHVAPPPGDSVAPDRPRLLEWSRRDAAGLAKATGLEFDDPGRQPDPSAVELANRALVDTIAKGAPIETKLTTELAIGRALWKADPGALDSFVHADHATTEATLADGARLRSKLGHYLGGTLEFEGEWYWGVDRLALLEERLRAAGLARGTDATPIVTIPQVECRHRPTNGHRPTLDFFCSLRSPYTYIAVARVRRLAANYGADLRLRFVLPMVMRGLPVPREKRLYILHDAKREAEHLGLPFGRIVDPVGRPTERGLAVLHHAVGAGCGPDFLESFMRGVWAEGLDGGDDADLGTMARRAGLDDRLVAGALADESWRAIAAQNREEMLALGLWGVPSFRVDDNEARWGQDRLWRVERDLIAATQARPLEETNR